MTKIATIAWKDTLVRFASRSEWLFFLVLPIFFTFIITQFAAMQDGGDNRIPLLVIDGDGSLLAGEFVAELERSDAVRPLLMPADEAQAAFNDRDAPALLTIPAGFEAAILAAQELEIEVLVDASNTNSLAAEQAVRAAAGRIGAALAIANTAVAEAERRGPFADAAARQAYFQESLALAQELYAAAPARVAVNRPPAIQEDDYDPAAQTSAGQLIIWVFIPLLGTSALFAYERSNGTLRRLLITPTSRSIWAMSAMSDMLMRGQGLAGVWVNAVVLLGFAILFFVVGVWRFRYE